jgi:hypothetical protein
MTATLATLRARVQQFLSDTGATAYTTGALDEALRQALAEYSEVAPRQCDTVLVLPAAGREIALNALDELDGVTAVYWPYDSAAREAWPPNQVAGFSLAFDDGQPLLILTPAAGNQPQAGDELRLWYTTPQHLDGLASDPGGVAAAGTTVPLLHESWLVTGAAGYAAVQRAGDVRHTYTETARAQANLEAWGQQRLALFRAKLAQLAATRTQQGQPFTQGWKLDDFDA